MKWFRLLPLVLVTFAIEAAEPISLSDSYSVLAPAIENDRSAENPSGLQGRVMAGFQGWFRAEGDGSGLGFHHYEKEGKFQPGQCTIELWPDLSEFEPEEKYPTQFLHKDGTVAHVFSSVNSTTVRRHFRWMREYGIDGVFVQRFGTLAKKRHRSFRLLQADNLKLMLCRDAAIEQERAYALMYDLSGLEENDFETIAADWKQLRTRMLLGSDPNDSAYLQWNGKPLVAIWGVGFNDDRDYSLALPERLIRFLKDNPEWGGCSVMLGVPYGWREQTRDAVEDPRLHELIQLADVVSPWSIGRYRRAELDAGAVVETQLADRRWCEKHEIAYLPVLYPGFSWKNLHGGESNAIPREKGKFLWDQFVATKAAGNRSAYIAMFDEIDEGTAIFKCSNNPPVGASTFLTYEGLPTDTYLWLTGEGGKLLRGEIPRRE